MAVDSNGQARVLRLPQHLAYWPACLLGNCVVPSGALAPKTLLSRIGTFDDLLNVGGAYQYWIRCLRSGARVEFSREPLVRLRQHAAQTSRVRGRKAFQLEIEHRVLMPFLVELEPTVAARLASATRLIALRTLVAREGHGAARRYARQTPLAAFGWSPTAGAAFAAYTAAHALPWRARRAVEAVVTRQLLGDRPNGVR